MSIALTGLLALAAAVRVITSANAVHAVFFLVLVFIATSVLRLTLAMEFMALVFLMVYVGAIAVLFLFVVMRLNVPSGNDSVNKLNFRPRGNLPMLAFLGSVILGIIIMVTINTNDSWVDALKSIMLDQSKSTDIEPLSWDRVSSMVAIGQVMYTVYCVEFLRAGIVLLVARVGAIILTLTSDSSVFTSGTSIDKSIYSEVVPARASTIQSIGQQVHEQHSRDSDRAVFLIS